MNKVYVFPDVNLATNDGLLCISNSLNANMLLAAYKCEVFPWSANPFTWWAPPYRAIMIPSEFSLGKRMQRAYRKAPFKYTMNQCFTEVIKCCASKKYHKETWISPEFIEAYTELHKMGYAQSAEVWQDNELVGGIYGVSIGKFFAGESMFNKVSNASTFCLRFLMDNLNENNYKLFDSQILNPHTENLGAFNIPRQLYMKCLVNALKEDNSSN